MFVQYNASKKRHILHIVRMRVRRTDKGQIEWDRVQPGANINEHREQEVDHGDSKDFVAFRRDF